MKRTPVRALWLVALALPVVAGACSDVLTRPDAAGELIDRSADAARQEIAILDCHANVREGTIDCAPPQPEAPEGMALDQRIVGGQNLYVRLTSYFTSYNAGSFSFVANIRNLSSSPMATADGVTRDSTGLRVFFQQQPTVTVGTGTITIDNATGVGMFTSTDQPYYQYGGSIRGAAQTDLGSDGILSPGELSLTKSWRFNVPETVENFVFTVLVATEMPEGALSSVAPQISSISPAVLAPGDTAIITGTGLQSWNSEAVTFGGRPALIVESGMVDEMRVIVPCLLTGEHPVVITIDEMSGVSYTQAVTAARSISVPLGQMLVLDNQKDVSCSELAPTGGEARYMISIFSNSASPASNAPFAFSGEAVGGGITPDPASPSPLVVTPDFSLEQFADQVRQQNTDERHLRLLEENRRIIEQYGSRLRGGAPAPAGRGTFAGDVSPTRTFRIPDLNSSSICSNYYVVSATQVYYDGKVAIYEDDATSNALKAANNAVMASNYQRIGDQFNADMEPIIRTYFGDVLRRDSITDNNGVVLALFTPRINNSFANTAGFVASCDLFPNDDANTPPVGGPYAGSAGSAMGSSNHGEIFYAYQPEWNFPGYSAGTPEEWYRSIRSTFIHETKHLSSYAARVANGAPLEVSWLEESTARHSEELWGRIAVDGMPWKGNTGYGSAGNPINIYCDTRPEGDPGCDANARRPASIMYRHFGDLYTHLLASNARLLSPFGRTASDNGGYFYAIGWSLVRYAVDRYAVDEAAFFRALNEANQTGIENLLARAGVTVDQLLAGWTLSLVLDDHPLWGASGNPDLQVATWHLRDIYAGLNADLPGSYGRIFPQVPTAFTFGTFSGPAITTMRGGSSLWYELSGVHTSPQLLRVEPSAGVGAQPAALRMGITRVE